MTDNPLSSKVTLDTTNYKAGIRDLNRSIREIESGFRASAASMADWDKSAGGLETRNKALSEIMEVQRKKVDALKSEYDRLSASGKASDTALTNLRIDINKATEALGKSESEFKKNNDAIKDLGKNTQTASKETKGMASNQSRAVITTGQLKGAMSGLGNAAKNVATGIGNVTKKLGQMALNVAKIAATIAAVSAVAIGGLLASTIGPASDLNETVSKVGVVFGDAADEVLKFGKSADTALGMSTNEALTAAGTYGNLFRAMGIASDISAGMSTNLVQLAGDLASFNNMDPGEVLDKLRAGLTGETEPLKSLGVNLNAATIEAKALEMGFKEVNGELPAAAKAQASYALILEQTTLAQGDFARTSGGLANQQRTLKAQLENLRGTIGTGLLPVVAAAYQIFNKFLGSPAIQDGAQRLATLLGLIGEGVQKAFSGDKAGMLASFTAGFGPFGETIGKVVGYVQEFVSILSGSGGDLGKIGDGIGKLLSQIFSDGAVSKAGMIKGGLGILTGLVTGITTALPKLIPVAVTLVTNLVQSIITMLPMLLNAGIQIILSLVRGIVPLLPTLVATGIQLIVTLLTGIAQAIPELIPTIAAIIPQMVLALVAALPMLIDAAIQIILALADGLIAAIPVLLPYIPQIVQALVEALIQIAPALLEAAIALITALALGLLQNLPLLLKTVAEIIGGVIEAFTSTDWGKIGSDLVDGVSRGFMAAWSGFKSNIVANFQNMVGTIKTLLGIASPSKVFAGIGKNMALGLGGGFENSFTKARKSIGGAVDSLTRVKTGGAVDGKTSSTKVELGGIHITINGPADERTVSRAAEKGVLRAMRAVGAQ